MAVLKNAESGRLVPLESDHLIGRSPRCALQLEDSSISAQHASLRWTGAHWELRDLGSLNGTAVDGTAIDPGHGHQVAKGGKVTFGKAAEVWELVDDGPPCVTLTCLDDEQAIFADGELLAIPSTDDPQATVYCGSDGRWRFERMDVPVSVLQNLDVVEIAGKRWRFICPAHVTPTVQTISEVAVGDIQLEFQVSRDEEHVEAMIIEGTNRTPLGSRGHNYLLLTLARIRLADAGQALPDTTCGWVDQEQILKGLGSNPSQLNIDIFRIRKQFAKLGLRNAGNVIERRPRAKQLRIGVRHLVITQL